MAGFFIFEKKKNDANIIFNGNYFCFVFGK